MTHPGVEYHSSSTIIASVGQEATQAIHRIADAVAVAFCPVYFNLGHFI